MPYFACPKCGERMYSAYDQREREMVMCVTCKTPFSNPYFRPTLEATVSKQTNEDTESE